MIRSAKSMVKTFFKKRRIEYCGRRAEPMRDCEIYLGCVGLPAMFEDFEPNICLVITGIDRVASSDRRKFKKRLPDMLRNYA